MSWWAGIPVTGHVGMPVDRVFRFESDCGHFKDDPLSDGKPVQLLPQIKPVVLADRGACSTTHARVFWARCRRLRMITVRRTVQKAVTVVQ